MYSYTCEYLYISLFIIFEFKVIITLNTSKIQKLLFLLSFWKFWQRVFVLGSLEVLKQRGKVITPAEQD